ncbi:hypothetical protein F4802DRAFT_598980 [Xylaria palmicola]|nr:hypothetical protein F4802DRAFT_598980 [Xylaria palmicola]
MAWRDSRSAVAYQPPSQPRRGAAPSAAGRAAGRGSWTTPKRVIWTGAFAAVTIVGAIYGAGLKTQQEYQAEKKQVLESPVEERIRALEARRAQLLTQKRPLENKLEQLRLRVQKQEGSAETTTAPTTTTTTPTPTTTTSRS